MAVYIVIVRAVEFVLVKDERKGIHNEMVNRFRHSWFGVLL